MSASEMKRMMSKYEIVIHWSEEDEAFVAEVPELPGCVADGETYQEALSNAEVIILRSGSRQQKR